MRSPLRWAGSKRMLLPRLRPFWPGGHTRYIEPFCGSACLFFDILPHRAILGDLNSELICALEVLKNQADDLLKSFRRIPGGSESYYRLRGLSPLELTRIERAARFLYLNRTCFNGIYRTNSNGVFNVPYGPPKGRVIDESVVKGASLALRSAKLLVGDFEDTLSHVRKGDFVYLDPPYCVDKRRVFREYDASSFAVSDLRRLSQQLRRLHRLGASFVITYADSLEARELLGRWKPRRVRVRRHIAGFSHYRRHAFELVASNRVVPL